MGTQQSGILDLLIADLAKDGELLKQAREPPWRSLPKTPTWQVLPIRAFGDRWNR